MKKKKSLRQLIFYKYYTQYQNGHGQSRHKDKQTGQDMSRIYSTRTYETYRQQGRHFADWCASQNIKTLKAARAAVPLYLSKMIESGNYSAWTISTAAAALGKLFQVDYRTFGVVLPKRRRADITRSRLTTDNDKHISDSRREGYARSLRCVGLRRREAEKVRGTDLFERDGKYYVHVRNGKGGKERDVLVYGQPEDVEALIRRFKAAQGGVVFGKLPEHLDVHSYRGEYATLLYLSVARPLETLPRCEKYYCRGDRAGVVYDRAALKYVSQMLGHNRIDVVPEHYLHL